MARSYSHDPSAGSKPMHDQRGGRRRRCAERRRREAGRGRQQHRGHLDGRLHQVREQLPVNEPERLGLGVRPPGHRRLHPAPAGLPASARCRRAWCRRRRAHGSGARAAARPRAHLQGAPNAPWFTNVHSGSSSPNSARFSAAPKAAGRRAAAALTSCCSAAATAGGSGGGAHCPAAAARTMTSTDSPWKEPKPL